MTAVSVPGCICTLHGVDPECPALIVPERTRRREQRRIRRQHRPKRRWLRQTDYCRCGEYIPGCPKLRLELTIELIAAHG